MCTCDEALNLLSAQLDGALTEQEAEQLHQHLSDCGACRALAQDLELLHDLLPQLAEEPPVGFHEGVMGRIAAGQVLPFPEKNVNKKRIWRTLIPLAAMFAVVLVGAGMLGHFQGQDGGITDVPVAMPMSASTPAPTVDSHIAPAVISPPPAAVAEDNTDDAAASTLPGPMTTESVTEQMGGGSPQPRIATQQEAPPIDRDAPPPETTEPEPGGASLFSAEKAGGVSVTAVTVTITPLEALDLVLAWTFGDSAYQRSAVLTNDGTTLAYQVTMMDGEKLISGGVISYGGEGANGYHFACLLDGADVAQQYVVPLTGGVVHAVETVAPTENVEP